MEDIDWLTMLSYRHELHHFSRALLSHNQKKTLTDSELEILSLLYLYPEESTPLALSRRSGMKKEAVSRCLKQLFDKNCIQKSKNPADERSYILSLSEIGTMELHQNYTFLLQPLYDLRRQMGPELDQIFRLIKQANIYINQLQK